MINKISAVLSFFVLITFQAIGQEDTGQLPIDKDTQLITYQDVIQQAGTADELYIRCIEWINVQYKNPADACRIRNRESGVIEILHRFELLNEEEGSKGVTAKVNYTLKLEFKPGRYRYTLSDLNLLRQSSSRFPVEKWLDKSDKDYSNTYESYLRQINTHALELINSLKAGMEPPVIKQEEKW
ncbi:MAG: hypothetical protein FD170_1244 [Bacteroidetes bacterium]|nr:MAG: hypothetical protein FD170_1244 [Bacteroidota bacterium]